MAQPLSKEAKKEVMKNIILKLHQGAPCFKVRLLTLPSKVIR